MPSLAAVSRRIAATLAVVTSMSACAPAASSPVITHPTVHILAPWGAVEQAAFRQMVRPWEQQTGNTIVYEGTRQLQDALNARIQRGTPPDLAILPNPSVLDAYAAAGSLVPLDSVLDVSALRRDYGSALLQLASARGQLYGVYLDAAVKGLIWYDPAAVQAGGLSAAFTPLPETWPALMTLSDQIEQAGTTPWCIGLEGGVASGWPGADWIQDFLLRTAGPGAYTDWYQGRLKWTSPQVRAAWSLWGGIVADPGMVYGGSSQMLRTNFTAGGDPLFTNPPGCYLHHQGSFITTFFQQARPQAQPGVDFALFGFPSIDSRYDGAEVIDGDVLGMFQDSSQARDLLAYLMTPAAQAIWVKRGGVLSANRTVPLGDYAAGPARDEARLLTGARILVADASSDMPQAMSSAFQKGVLDYVAGRQTLDAILRQLDAVQAKVYR
ncbi:MAG TPA: ABC transporter substrate-binding protein [Candidatus Limnocylindrales bacterium]|nr:ABC transporter substrate-binding protein [Candidatus Limnocylindrales bacterium]